MAKNSRIVQKFETFDTYDFFDEVETRNKDAKELEEKNSWSQTDNKDERELLMFIQKSRN